MLFHSWYFNSKWDELTSVYIDYSEITYLCIVYKVLKYLTLDNCVSAQFSFFSNVAPFSSKCATVENCLAIFLLQ